MKRHVITFTEVVKCITTRGGNMDISKMTVRQLRLVLKELSMGGLGVKDIRLAHAIEDEINNRKGLVNGGQSTRRN